MNLNILSTNVMLAQSKQWLTDAAVRGPIDRHALGQAVLAELPPSDDVVAAPVPGDHIAAAPVPGEGVAA